MSTPRLKTLPTTLVKTHLRTRLDHPRLDVSLKTVSYVVRRMSNRYGLVGVSAQPSVFTRNRLQSM